MMQFAPIAILTLCCGGFPGTVVVDRAVPPRRVAEEFRQALDRPISAGWKNVNLREILRRIEKDREIAILLDRRIDPAQTPVVDLSDATLHRALVGIAERVSAGAAVAGNTVMIGPSQSIAKLRTLIQLRSDELVDPQERLPDGRRFALGKRQTFHWNDLDRPVDLVRRIGQRYELTLHGLEKIPHDLWAGGTLPDVNANETLALVLIQFDLTFRWTEQAKGIDIVTIPDDVFIARTYRPRRIKATTAVEHWQKRIAGLQMVVKGNVVVAKGLLEQHEELDLLLNPRPRRRARPAVGPTPLSRRTFTLRVKNVPAARLLEDLRSKGINIVFDKDALRTAGIDLDQRITLDVNDVSSDELFRALCGPLGLKYQIDRATVTLSAP
jgi:hypothetical protein